jgi:hypothetical protein
VEISVVSGAQYGNSLVISYLLMCLPLYYRILLFR